MIRKPQLSDTKDLVNLCRLFWEESLKEYGLKWNEEDATQTVINFIKTLKSLVIEKEGKVVGVVAGIVIPSFFNYRSKIFTEVIWYVKPEYRRYGLKLYAVLEQTLKNQDIDKITMINMSNSKAGKIGKFYQKKGYQFMETVWMKQL